MEEVAEQRSSLPTPVGITAFTTSCDDSSDEVFGVDVAKMAILNDVEMRTGHRNARVVKVSNDEIAVSPDEHGHVQLFSGCRGPTSTLRPLRSKPGLMKESSTGVFSLACIAPKGESFSSSGKTLLVYVEARPKLESEREICIWDVQTGKRRSSLPWTRRCNVFALRWFPECRESLFVGGTGGMGVLQYDLEQSILVRSLVEGPRAGIVMGIEFDETSGTLFDVWLDGTIRTWDCNRSEKSPTATKKVDGSTACISTLLCSDRRELYLGGGQGRVAVRDIRKIDQELRSFVVCSKLVCTMARVGVDSFLSTSDGVELWNGRGKKLGSLAGTRRKLGLCVIGGEFDGPPFSSDDVEDADERIGFIRETLLGGTLRVQIRDREWDGLLRSLFAVL